MTADEWDSLRWFRAQEFRCRHCGIERMDLAFMRTLDHLRELMGRPLNVTSGYRCPTYNATAATTGEAGPHTTGKAVDILIHGEDAYHLLSKAITLGFTGIGLNQKGEHAKRYVHLDTLVGKANIRPRVWTY